MQNERSKTVGIEETVRLWWKRVCFGILRYARSKGFPVRRVNYLWRNLLKLALFFSVISISVCALGQLGIWLGSESAVFSSAENQAQWFVELLIIIFAGVVLHYALREKGSPAPALILDDRVAYETKNGGRVFGIKIKNDGDYAAIDCVASLEIEGIEKPDIQSRKKLSER